MNHKVTRINSYTTLAEFQLQTTRLNLTDSLRKRIETICTLLKKKTIASEGYATYITDEVLNLFGTHFIVRQKIGGILSKIDAVDISGYQNSVDQTLSASAEAKFASFFKIKGTYTTEYSDIDKYDKSVTDTFVATHGGTAWKTADTFTYDTWIDSLSIKPATIGLHALYILDFPNFILEELIAVRNIFEKRLEVYYKNNYYLGCADRTANNYVSYANVFDSTICNYHQSFHFGGMYTVSNIDSFNIANILTQKFECPNGFVAKPILHQEFQGAIENTEHCHYYIIYKYCWTETKYDTVITNTFIKLPEFILGEFIQIHMLMILPKLNHVQVNIYLFPFIIIMINH